MSRQQHDMLHKKFLQQIHLPIYLVPSKDLFLQSLGCLADHMQYHPW
uniref:Uncharacterized protein n=1 Tax=Rhizophora mucronata TaxID=61149 RepID=A0A2P2PTT0_RHIMU